MKKLFECFRGAFVCRYSVSANDNSGNDDEPVRLVMVSIAEQQRHMEIMMTFFHKCMSTTWPLCECPALAPLPCTFCLTDTITIEYRKLPIDHVLRVASYMHPILPFTDV